AKGRRKVLDRTSEAEGEALIGYYEQASAAASRAQAPPGDRGGRVDDDRETMKAACKTHPRASHLEAWACSPPRSKSAPVIRPSIRALGITPPSLGDLMTLPVGSVRA